MRHNYRPNNITSQRIGERRRRPFDVDRVSAAPPYISSGTRNFASNRFEMHGRDKNFLSHKGKNLMDISNNVQVVGEKNVRSRDVRESRSNASRQFERFDTQSEYNEQRRPPKGRALQDMKNLLMVLVLPTLGRRSRLDRTSLKSCCDIVII